MELTAGKVKEGMAEAGAKSADLWMVPIGEIHVIENFNERIRGPELEAHIDWLTGQIKANGFNKHKPLAGYVAQEGKRNVIYVYDGHCRLEAAKRAVEGGLELEVLPVVISPKGTDMGDLVSTQATAAGSKPLEPIEKAMVCKKLINLNWDEDKIAYKLGMTKFYVSSLLGLVASSPQIQALVKSGKVSATNAMKEIKKNGAKAAETLQGAVDKAAGAGKARATGKDLQEPKAAAGDLAKAVLKFDAENQPSWNTPEKAQSWGALVRLAKGGAA